MTLPTHRILSIQTLIALAIVVTGSATHAAEPGTTTAVIKDYAETYPAYGVSESVRAGDFIYIGGIIAQDARGLTMAGMVCGIIGTVLFALQLLVVVAWVFIAVLAVGASAAGNP